MQASTATSANRSTSRNSSTPCGPRWRGVADERGARSEESKGRRLAIRRGRDAISSLLFGSTGRPLMDAAAKILVVDDTPLNIKLLGDLLTVKGYAVSTAANGEEALAKLASEIPDIVLLDVMMPGLSGYDVCRRIRADPTTALLPVVMVTSLDPQTDRVKGIEAGADDFISKPINQPELFARVRSLLRIKALQDEVRQQSDALKEWNVRLEERVREQVAELERLSQLKRFFSPAVADAILSAGEKSILTPHRRAICYPFV